MSVNENATYFAQARVLPVLTPLSVASGTTIGRILFDAGLHMQEITLRNPAGLENADRDQKGTTKLIVGAGSVLTPEMGEAAIHAGAHFLVSPGMNEVLLQFAGQCSVPFLPVSLP